MNMKKENEKAGLKLNIQKNEDNGIWSHYFMANRWETMETVTDFIFLGPKITADSDCSHEVKRRLLLRKTAMIKLGRVFKNRDIILLTRVHIVIAMVFPVVVYNCDSWTIKKV